MKIGNLMRVVNLVQDHPLTKILLDLEEQINQL
jgi:hypothetical protein